MPNSRSHKNERKASYLDTAKSMHKMTTDIIQSSPILNKVADVAGRAAHKWSGRFDRADKRAAAKQAQKKRWAKQGYRD